MRLTAEQREDFICRFATGPALLRAALGNIPANALQWRPAAGNWSAHEPTIFGYDQDGWAAVFNYHAHPLEAALATVEAVRANTVPMLRRLPESAWAKAGTHSESGHYSAEDWLRVYAGHLETHAHQIERNLAAWQAAPR